MCATCGCSDHVREREHEHEHEHEHERGRAGAGRIVLEAKVLAKNDRIAELNRQELRAQKIVALNLVSSPGAGKTTLLERTVAELAGIDLYVIEGDQATANDAERIRAAGGRALQVNTGTGCHLDAHMIAHALGDLCPRAGSLLFVENVGNLVCPALFDLGERKKVLISSVTDGDDKPHKYPHMFRASSLVVLNKLDLLPHVRFDRDRFAEAVRTVNPHAELIELSATRGDGLAHWYTWLRREVGRDELAVTEQGTAP
jgi:hydrogenase nickel incorporation protein HypB